MLRFHTALKGPLGLLLIAVAVLLGGCVSFDHLTRIPATGEAGPKASECGGCHGAQYREWQETVHAKAFTSPTFQEAAGNPPEAECLQCHAPLGMRDGQMASRAFNREEGVTCVSCHLVDGAMHGPHGSTALVSPHPIKKDHAAYTSPSVCAPCHDETHEQWQRATAGHAAPTCQECHQASVQRTASQGTNVFSNILVAFEKKETTRSHDIRLEKMARVPEGIVMTLLPHRQGSARTIVEVTVRNNLPHNLPTGTYGSKEIRLVPVVGPEKRRLNEQGVVIASAQHGLAAGEEKTVRISLAGVDLRSAPLRLDLERQSESFPDRNPIVLASLPLPSAAEARP
jgi:Zn-finger protein